MERKSLTEQQLALLSIIVASNFRYSLDAASALEDPKPAAEGSEYGFASLEDGFAAGGGGVTSGGDAFTRRAKVDSDESPTAGPSCISTSSRRALRLRASRYVW